jgi:glycine C-acetyltransferase
MIGNYKEHSKNILRSMDEAGLLMDERVVFSRQGPKIKVRQGEVRNFCTNNYLGLANHPVLLEAAKRGLEEWGYGLSAGRTLTGTQEIHLRLEEKIAAYLGVEEAVLHGSCFDANGGVFEALLDENDALISDKLNHASIIDGIRLCKAERFVYEHSDMNSLEGCLKQSRDKRFRLIVTDGVFSMDSDFALLPEICHLAEKHEAMVMIDDAHATGFVGVKGRGTHEHFGVMSRVDIITSTLGKALGGASGGFVAGRKEIMDLVRAKSRPCIFSNSLPPVVVAASLASIELIEHADDLRRRLWDNARYFRKEITAAGFQIKPGEHPIVPVMLGEAPVARGMARDLLPEGVFVIGFGFPIVPKGQARIRVINSAVHEREDIDFVVDKFAKVGRKYGVI